MKKCIWLMLVIASYPVFAGGNTSLDYTSVVGGPSLTVHNVYQNVNGDWFVASDDRRVWRWSEGQWHSMMGVSDIKARPTVNSFLSTTIDGLVFYVGNDFGIYHTRESSTRLPSYAGAFEENIVASVPYEDGSVVLTTSGTVLLCDFRGFHPTELLTLDFNPVELRIQGHDMIVYNESGDYVLYDLLQEKELFSGAFKQPGRTAQFEVRDKRIYALKDNQIEILAPPFYKNVSTLPVPITGSTLSVSEDAWIAVSSTHAVATSTDAGLSWDVAHYTDWEIVGAKAGSHEFCVFGTLGEVHFSNNGKVWTNNWIEFKRAVKGIVSLANRTLIYSNFGLYEIADNSSIKEIESLQNFTIDNVNRLSGLGGSIRFSFVSGDSSIVTMNASSQEASQKHFDFPVYGVTQNEEPVASTYLLTDEKLVVYKSGKVETEFDVSSEISSSTTAVIQWSSWLNNLLILTENKLLRFDVNDGSFGTIHVADEPWTLQRMDSYTHCVLFGDTIVFKNRKDWTVHKESREINSLSSIEWWWGEMNYCKFSESTGELFGEWEYRKIDEMYPSAIGENYGLLDNSSRVLCDSGTIAHIYWGLEPYSVEPLTRSSSLDVSVSPEIGSVVAFNIEATTPLSSVSWQLVGVSGQTVANGELHAQTNTAHITISRGFPPGLYILVVRSEGAGVGTFKVLLE